MKILVLFLVTALYIQTEGQAPLNCNCVDYYWRDYCGRIPDDAIVGCYSPTGAPLYIGSVYYRNFELLVGMIENGVSYATAYTNILNTTQNIRILCSQRPQNLKWATVQTPELYRYWNRNLVVGGSEAGNILHVAKVFEDNRCLIGKVFRNDTVGMAYPSFPENRPRNARTYQVLYYDCQNYRCTLPTGSTGSNGCSAAPPAVRPTPPGQSRKNTPK